MSDLDMSQASPYAVPFSVSHGALELCLACDMLDLATRKELTRELESLPPARIVEAALRQRQAPCRELPGHETVSVSVTITSGTREDPQMQFLLAQVEPGLQHPVGRYRRHRRPVNDQILNVLIERFGPDIHRTRADGSDEDSGDPWRLGSRKGEAPQEPLGETLARLPEDWWPYWNKKVMTQVSVQSGITLLAVQFFTVGLPLFRRLERVVEQAKGDRHTWLRERMGWLVFDWYLDLYGHVAAVTALRGWASTRTNVPLLRAALQMDGLPAEVRSRLIGDVSVLQFMIHRSCALYPTVKKAEQLVAALKAAAYTRLPDGQRQDAREVLEAVVKDMASELERATIVEVDWRPLFSSLTFEQRKKRK